MICPQCSGDVAIRSEATQPITFRGVCRDGCGFETESFLSYEEAANEVFWCDDDEENDDVIDLLEENDQLCADLERLLDVAQRMHDECSILANGKRLNMGPMMEPREATVLELRKILESLT